jgi:hypothetical protein
LILTIFSTVITATGTDSRLVQSLLYKLALRIDPATKAGNLFTQSTICTTPGDRFSEQQILNIYNDARLALFSYLKATRPLDVLVQDISGSVVQAGIFFTTSGNQMYYTLPDGYVRFVSLNGLSVSSGEIRSITLLENTQINDIIRGHRPWQQSSDNRYIFEVGKKLIHYGSFVGSSNITCTEWTVTLLNKIQATQARFTRQLAPGSLIWLDDNVNYVASVIDDNNITVTNAFGASVSGTTMRKKLTGGAWSVGVGSTTLVTGVGTAFTTELTSGAYISLDSYTNVVAEILSDTQMTVETPYLTNVSGTVIERNLGIAGVSWTVTPPLDLVVGTGSHFLTSLRETLNVVNGTGTHFVYDLRVGNNILLDSNAAVVRSITSDTQLTIAVPLGAAASGSTITKVLTGTAEIALPDLTRVIGHSTLFTTELRIGESVSFDGTLRSISYIVSDTLMYVTLPFADESGGMEMTVDLGAGWAVSAAANNILLDATPVTVREVFDDTHISIVTPLGAAASGSTIKKVITGTANCGFDKSGKRVDGIGTLFTSELRAGELVLFNATPMYVSYVVSDTMLFVTTPFDPELTGATMAVVLGTAWAVTADLNVVNGVGTAFLSQLTAGCHVYFGVTQKIISSVLSNTKLIVTTVFGGNTSGTVINRILTGSAWSVTPTSDIVSCADAKFKSEAVPLSSIELYHEDGSFVTRVVDSVIDDATLKVSVTFSGADGGVGIREFLLGDTWTTLGDLSQVVGTGTKFLTELMGGLAIRLSHNDGSYIDKIVSEVYDDNTFDVTVAFDTVDSGTAIAASNYTLQYFGITTYQLADVYQGATLESFNPDYHQAILQVAEALANEAGGAQVGALLKGLLG